MKIISRFIAAIIFIAFFFFAVKNTQDVTLHFFMGYERTDPLVLIILVCFLVGVVLGIAAMLPAILRYRKAASRQKRALVTIQSELEALRNASGTGTVKTLDPVVPESHLH